MADLVGKNFIDFELPFLNDQGKIEKLKLSDVAKNNTVLLLFFPAAWTGACTKEVCAVRDSLAEYTKVNAKVIGISVDMPWALDKFKKDQQLNFTLVSDANKTTIKAYDVVWPDFVGISAARRSAFIIKGGKITYQWLCTAQPDLPPFDEIKKKL